MTYPNRHLYLTIHWTQAGATQEQGQVGIRFDSALDASQTLVDGCAGGVQAMWTGALAVIASEYTLSFLRLAAIGIDGKYIPGSVAFDHTFPAGVNGGGGVGAGRFPLQMACATTLVTATPRGRASKGRIYLPWINNALGADYIFSAANANARSQAVAAMVTALNGAMPGPATVMSKVAAGTKHAVTAVKTGRKPDIQRRRAGAITEQYSANWNV